MFFNSLEYLLFFPTVAAGYFLLPHKFRLGWILAASYCFYGAWHWEYLGLLACSTLLDYGVGMGLEATERPARRHLLLALSLIGNLGALCAFKYANFLFAQLEIAGGWMGQQWALPRHDWVFPIGISFYTLQTISYSLDVYYGRLKAERHLGRFALYVAFFPQLVAGPIERATKLLPQFHFQYRFSAEKALQGVHLITWGFFKKLVVADRLGAFVDQAFAQPEALHLGTLALAGSLYVFQLYCDFSGYSDIAIGSARVLGLQLTRNFGNAPYFSPSFSVGIAQWHITLINWLKDYIFFPLARRYRKPFQRHLATLLIFFLIGLWHGASWAFVAWGMVWAAFLISEYEWTESRAYAGLAKRVPAWAMRLGGSAAVFSIMAFAALFFRAPSLARAGEMLAAAGRWAGTAPLAGVSPYLLYSCLAAVAVLEALHFWMKDQTVDQFWGKLPAWQSLALYAFLFVLILFGGYQNSQSFIYFDF
jgi:D-alanyl-lipoteichoic acid acyltransferase DltB (MBOAT superfamily)